MELLIGWVVFSFIVGFAAERRYGRSGVGWFLLSAVTSPLIAGLILIIVGDSPERRSAATPSAPTRRCPDCAELIQEQARVCRFCGARINPTAEEPRTLVLTERADVQEIDLGKLRRSRLFAALPDENLASRRLGNLAP